MRLDFLIDKLQRIIEAVPEEVVEEYKFFALPSSLKKYDYHLTESFVGYNFEYFNDGLMNGQIILNNQSFYFDEL